MTVTNDRQVAGIFHAAGVRSDDVVLRVMAQVDPETFAGPRDALKGLEAGLGAGA